LTAQSADHYPQLAGRRCGRFGDTVHTTTVD